MEIVRYTEAYIEAVVAFERQLRQEEPDFCWPIDDAYVAAVRQSFHDPRFADSVSLLACDGVRVVGRIDSTLICSHFDGSVKAYLDWICVLKSARHRGVARQLLQTLRQTLREEYGVDTLIALMACNDEAQRFYHAVQHAEIHDEGIWMDC